VPDILACPLQPLLVRDHGRRNSTTPVSGEFVGLGGGRCRANFFVLRGFRVHRRRRRAAKGTECVFYVSLFHEPYTDQDAASFGNRLQPSPGSRLFNGDDVHSNRI
jgi:hypothetical protein